MKIEEISIQEIAQACYSALVEAVDTSAWSSYDRNELRPGILSWWDHPENGLPSEEKLLQFCEEWGAGASYTIGLPKRVFARQIMDNLGIPRWGFTYSTNPYQAQRNILFPAGKTKIVIYEEKTFDFLGDARLALREECLADMNIHANLLAEHCTTERDLLWQLSKPLVEDHYAAIHGDYGNNAKVEEFFSSTKNRWKKLLGSLNWAGPGVYRLDIEGGDIILGDEWLSYEYDGYHTAIEPVDEQVAV